MSKPVTLSALGMNCAAGNSPKQVWEQIYTEPSPELSPHEKLIQGPVVPVGRVRAELPSIPDRWGGFRCRTNRLALQAMDQITPEIERACREYGRERVGVVTGTSTSGIAEAEAALRTHEETGALPERFHYSQMEIGGVGSFVRRALNLEGPCYTISTSCSSSAKVFGSGRALIANDWCDAVVVGGADSLCGLTLNGFHSLQLLSDERCNPMSRNRSGINIGEGAAFFLMETGEGPVHLQGVGESSDAHRMNAPDPDGTGAETSMDVALRDAGVGAREVDYVNLHGTGTRQNDAMESKAVARLFEHPPPCSSTKPFLGHTLGAAGALEAGICWLMIDHVDGTSLPLVPHFWDGEEDDGFPSLSLVEGSGFHREVDGPIHLMSNAFAFGGHNCTILLGTEPPS